MKRWFELAAPGLLLVIALFARLQEGTVVQELRHLVFDSYQRLAPREYEALPVRIVDIDEESLKRLGQWPWPRTVMARIVDRLAESGAAAVALDILYAEPDRMSPAGILEAFASQPGYDRLRDSLANMPDPDSELAAAFGRANTAIAFVLLDRPRDEAPAVKAGLSSVGDDPMLFVTRFPGAVAALPPLQAAAMGNGFVNSTPDSDGVIRTVPLLLALDDQIYPSLAAEALRIAQGASTYIVKSSGAQSEQSFGEHTGITHVKIGAITVPTEATGQMLLHDTGHVDARFISAWTVLEQGFDPTPVAGNIVLIGASAEALKDLRATPLNPTSAGVELHAQALEQMLAGDYLTRPDWADGAEIVFLVVLGLVLMVAVPRMGALGAAVIGVLAIAGAIGGSWIAFREARMLFDPLLPVAATFGVYMASSLMSYMRTEGEKRNVRMAFGRYLSPVLVEELTRHPERLKLGGEMRELTLLFCDIRGFTRIAEGLRPEELTHLINGFLTPMTTVIQAHGGTIDKYIGDCIMAFWNAPMRDEAHAKHAGEAALAMREELRRLNQDRAELAKRAGRKPIDIEVGIGLNTGEACVGNMGSHQRFDYSVLGDAVNVASRLEALSRVYGVDIVIGEDTAAEASQAALLELDLVRVKGRAKPSRIFTLQGGPEVRAAPWFAELEAAHARLIEAYRAQRWDEAKAALASCRAHEGGPAGLYDLYEQRIMDYVETSPPPEWDGVYTAATKAG